MIDLHTHTDESDGTYSPAELVNAALEAGLEALAITDHDTFAGYDQAAPIAAAHGFDLVCGIEVNTRPAQNEERRPGRGDVHLLGYFVNEPPSVAFRQWLFDLVESRRERNSRLVESLQSMGVQIDLREVEAIGRTLTGRPHFARVLVNKGYAATPEEAFRKYLGETAPAYVHRHSPDTATGIQQIAEAGGLAVVAHPVRLGIRKPEEEEAFLRELRDAGLGGIEVFHSDHRETDVERYRGLAQKLDLAITGGSDFHGWAKPSIKLGTGANGNLRVERSVLDELRKRAR